MMCNLRDEKFASLALSLCKNSNLKHHQHGCVAVLNGKIIARGWNSDRCFSKDGILKNVCSCHAEMDCLRKMMKLVGNKAKGTRCLLQPS